MMYRIIPFGHHHEQEVPLIVLFNEQLSVELLPFGAAVERCGCRIGRASGSTWSWATMTL